MISSDFKNKKNLIIQGSIAEVSAECVLIMREIYKRNKEQYGQKIAASILTNMVLKAIEEKEYTAEDYKKDKEGDFLS